MSADFLVLACGSSEAALNMSSSATNSIQEDFTIMVEGSDGRYYLQAGAVVIAGAPE